jgi:hypothetical protein
MSETSSQETAVNRVETPQSTFESVPVLERLDEWFYLDPQGRQQGPFKSTEMREWFEAGYFKPHLPIRYGNEGGFSPLASQFGQGQIPFSGPPRHLDVELQKQREEEQRHRILMLQRQQMLHLQQQQQRMLQINREENLRREMQRIEMQRQQEHQIFQQQQMIQQQHLVMQQQTAWQRSQREGIMTALGISDMGSVEQLTSPSTIITETNNQAQSDPEIQSHQNGMVQSSEKTQLNDSLQGSVSVWNDIAQKDVHLSPVPSATDTKQSVDIFKQPSSPQKSKSAMEEPDKREEGNVNVLQHEAPKRCNNSTVWNEKPNSQKEFEKSVRKIEEKEQVGRGDEPKANLVQMGAQLKMMLGVEETARSSSGAWSSFTTSQQTLNAWNAGGATTGQETAKSLRDILAEEERLALERAKKSEVSGSQASSHWVNVVAGTNINSSTKSTRSLGPVPASVLKSTRNSKATAAVNTSESHSGEKKLDVSENDSSFWNFGAAGQSKAINEVSHVSAFGVDISSSNFMSWCSSQLKSLGGIEDLTLVEYCASLEDPGEIREYLAAYLGSTPRVSAFATEFIQKKKSLKKSKKLSNTNITELSGDFSQKKGKRRSKGQKIDPTLLNYSVGSN